MRRIEDDIHHHANHWSVIGTMRKLVCCFTTLELEGYRKNPTTSAEREERLEQYAESRIHLDKVGGGQAMVENTMEKQVCQRVMRRFVGGQKLQGQRAPLVEHVCVAKEEDNQGPRE